MNMNSFLRHIVRGNIWKCKMWNGSVFEWWTPFVVTRTEARKKLLEIANGDYENLYFKNDIKHLWQTESKRI